MANILKTTNWKVFSGKIFLYLDSFITGLLLLWVQWKIISRQWFELRFTGLGSQVLYSTTNSADNILGRFMIILQNQIPRVDSFTNLTKRWVFRWVFRLNWISPHNLIFFGEQFRTRGPYTANAHLQKLSCLNFTTFRARSSWDLMEYLL